MNILESFQMSSPWIIFLCSDAVVDLRHGFFLIQQFMNNLREEVNDYFVCVKFRIRKVGRVQLCLRMIGSTIEFC